MTIYHDEVEIEDFEYDPEEEQYTYPCPCGDVFTISKADLLAGETEAVCNSCSLVVKVIYDLNKLLKEEEETNSAKKSQQQTQKA